MQTEEQTSQLCEPIHQKSTFLDRISYWGNWNYGSWLFGCILRLLLLGWRSRPHNSFRRDLTPYFDLSSTECCRGFMLPRSTMWLLNYGINISSEISFPFDNFEVWFHLWGAQPKCFHKSAFYSICSRPQCKNFIFGIWLSSISEVNVSTWSSEGLR